MAGSLIFSKPLSAAGLRSLCSPWKWGLEDLPPGAVLGSG